MRLVKSINCDPGASYAVTNGTGTAIAPGANVVGMPSIDSQSIDPTASPATTPVIFTGGWATSATSTVKNWASNWKGDQVCSGGATTGSHCGTVTDDAVAVPGLTGSWYVRAHASGVFAGQGDSGGSIYRAVTGGVQARGILKAGVTGTETYACGTEDPAADGLACYTDIVYVPISVVLNSWNYSLEVG